MRDNDRIKDLEAALIKCHDLARMAKAEMSRAYSPDEYKACGYGHVDLIISVCEGEISDEDT